MSVEKEWVDWSTYGEDLEKLGSQIPRGEFGAIYAPPRGGLPVATFLSHYLGIERLLVTLGDVVNCEESNILLVDDLSDTGKTLRNLTTNLKFLEKRYKVATLYRKDETVYEPDYCVRTINAWVVFPYERE